MWLELLLCSIVLVGIAVLFYKGAVHEFQILQHDWSADVNWSTLLSERAPVVVRDIPTELLGGWKRATVSHRAWPVLLSNGSGRVRSSCADWVQTPLKEIDGRTMENGERLSISAGIPDLVRDWRTAGLYRWTWMPTVSSSVFLLPPTETACIPLRRVRSDCCWIVCTDGAPLRLWLAHEGAIPADMMLEGRNPWTLTAKEVPWIVDVKFMELRLRPGCAVLLPTHWWVAVKPELPVEGKTVGDGSWGWMADLDTPISWILQKLPSKR
jgi:hypothetical protein